MHHYAKNIVKKSINVKDTLALLKELAKADLAPSRIDIGRLGTEWLNEGKNYKSISEFVTDKLKAFIGQDKITMVPKDVVLYGFGF